MPIFRCVEENAMKKNISINLLITLLIGFSFTISGQSNPVNDIKPQSFDLNRQTERQIKGGEIQEFQFKLKKGEFARAEVLPTNIDVIVSLFDPDGKTVIEADGDSTYLWQISVSAISEKSGIFKLQIRGKGKNVVSGIYAAKLVELRQSLTNDRKRLEAEKTLVQTVKFGQESKLPEYTKSLETILTLWREIGDKHWEAITMWNLGWAYIFTNRINDALTIQNEALKIFRDVNDRTGEAASLNGIGVIYLNQNNIEQARNYLEKAMMIRKALKRLRSEYGTLGGLLSVYNDLNLTEKLIESIERQLEIGRELKNREFEREALNLLGLYYSKESDNLKAQPYLEQALEIDRELGDKVGQVQRLTYLGTVYSGLSRYGDVLKVLNEALKISEEIQDKGGQSLALKEIGNYYVISLGNAKDGLDYLHKALNLNREVGKSKSAEISILFNLSLAYLNLGDNEKLIKYAEEGLQIAKDLGDLERQIDFSTRLGIGYKDSGQIDKALVFFEQSVAIARNGKLKLKEAISLSQLAGFYSSNQEYEKALRIDEEALKITRELKNQKWTGLILGSLGNFYLNLRNYETAQSYYEEALEISRKIKDKEQESSLLHKIGILFLSQRKFAETEDYMEKALKITEESNFTSNRIYILSSLGILFLTQSKFEESANYYEKGLKIAENNQLLFWQASLNNSLGNLSIQQNQYEKAQIYLEKSIQISKKSKDTFSEGLSYQILGSMHYSLSQYDKARNYYEKVLKISKETKNRWLLGFAASGTGSIYNDLNNNQVARINLEQSLTLMREVSDKAGEGSVLNNLGITYLNLKDYVNAQKTFEESLIIARAVKNKQGEVYPLVNLGTVFLNKNQFLKSDEFYNEGLILAQKVKDRVNEGYAFNGLGKLAFKQKKYDEANRFYQKALPIAKEIQLKKLEGTIFKNLMELYRDLGKPQTAIVYGKQSVNIFQEIRGNLKSFDKESQQSFLKDKETAYRTLADLLIVKERFSEAQMVLDWLKEEEFSQLTRTDGKSETIPYGEAEADLIGKIENLIVLERRREELLENDSLTAEQKREADDLLKKIEQANEALNTTLQALAKSEISIGKRADEFKNFEKLKTTLTSLRERTNNSGIVALYTLLSKEDTAENKNPQDEKTKVGWIIMITEKGQKAYPIDVADFNKTVFQLKDALSSDKYDPRPVAQKLYNAMFRQRSAKQNRTLEQDLQEYLGKYPNKTLMWSLDGVLRYVPMSVLHDGKNYLAEKYLNTVFTEQSIKSLETDNLQNWKVLGLGVSEEREGFKALPGVKVELEAIVREENSANGILDGTIKLNGNFRKDEFFNIVGGRKYKVVHIASHYSFKPFQQKDSFLLVGDGYLTLGEMVNKDKTLFSSVDLLTLSACETGISGNGKEIEGFPVKAQELGAKSVIASLWKVPDAGTPELMIRFYKNRQENPNVSKGEAFRQAQLSLLSTYSNTHKIPEVNNRVRAELAGKILSELDLPLFVKDDEMPFAHPHYWSSFVLIGNWR